VCVVLAGWLAGGLRMRKTEEKMGGGSARMSWTALIWQGRGRGIFWQLAR